MLTLDTALIIFYFPQRETRIVVLVLVEKKPRLLGSLDLSPRPEKSSFTAAKEGQAAGGRT